MFLSHEPNHWCSQPDLHQLAPELNWTQRLHLGSPLEREDGDLRLYSRCRMYQVNWTEVFQENGGSWPAQPNTSWPQVECQHGWSYDTEEFVNTLVTDLDLVCTNQWWPSTSTALFYVGSLIGNILFGQIADRFVMDKKGADGRFNV